eukprot:TRINITY_DN7442_c0_g1_i1.p1 TRINITY_DN7442_c0_g1~~TRINITY_DN7442_c0_g1_i1.p1  ORF type:complete len:186 (-),score=51.47 TRINITY_DN7442_c0_g1_i1:44-601(-)
MSQEILSKLKKNVEKNLFRDQQSLPAFKNELERMPKETDFSELYEYAMEQSTKKFHPEYVMTLFRSGLVVQEQDDSQIIDWAITNKLPQYLEEILHCKKVKPSIDNNSFVMRCVFCDSFECLKILIRDERVDPADNDNVAFRYAKTKGMKDFVDLLEQDERVAFGNHSSYPKVSVPLHPRRSASL